MLGKAVIHAMTLPVSFCFFCGACVKQCEKTVHKTALSMLQLSCSAYLLNGLQPLLVSQVDMTSQR